MFYKATQYMPTIIYNAEYMLTTIHILKTICSVLFIKPQMFSTIIKLLCNANK